MSAKNKMLRRATGAYLARDKSGGGATTLSAAAAAGATTISTVGNVGLTAGQSFRVDDGEDVERVEVQSISGAGPYTVTLAKPLIKAHASGAAVVQQTVYDLGHTKSPFQTTQAVEQTDIVSGLQRLVLTRDYGFEKFGVQGVVHGHTLYNIAFALGIPLSFVNAGAGTVASPSHMSLMGDEIATENNVMLINTYVLQDGTVKVQEFWGVEVEPNLSVPLGIGQDGAIALNFACYGCGVESDGALTMAIDSSIRPTKAKVFGDITGFGLWVAHATPAATTVATAAAAGAQTLILASGTSYAGGDWIQVDLEDRTEIHWVGSVVTATLTLKTKLTRAMPVGTAVKRLTQLPFAAIGKDGVTLGVSAQMTEVYNGLRRLMTAERLETVDVQIQAQLLELTLANRAYAAGINQANVQNSRLAITDALGVSPPIGAYVQGVLKDGLTVNLLNIWGPVQDLSSIAQQLGDPNTSSVPMTLHATSGFQFLQYQ